MPRNSIMGNNLCWCKLLKPVIILPCQNISLSGILELVLQGLCCRARTGTSLLSCVLCSFFSPVEEVGKVNKMVSEKGLWKWLLLSAREDWVELLLCLTACQHKAPLPLPLQRHAEGFRLSFWTRQSPLIKLLKLCAPAGASLGDKVVLLPECLQSAGPVGPRLPRRPQGNTCIFVTSVMQQQCFTAISVVT